MLKNKKTNVDDKDFSDFENVCMLGRNSLIRDNRLIAYANSKISGSLMLDIYCQQSLIISEEAVVVGDIYADTVHVHGKVAGNIHATQKVHIHEKAQICGMVQCKVIKIDEGAFCKIDGSVGSTEKLTEPYRTANDPFYTENIDLIRKTFDELISTDSDIQTKAEAQKQKATRFRLKTEEKASETTDSTSKENDAKKSGNSLIF
ncbi:Polymer-forming protein [Cyclonatronum proteinivorum]|uniref:Polymer-forming protein n=1 Tax=Cyclonatronum proteinivorum TaxID=1457365 RepID=A0A345ULA1_9BACT|nr:polymer-forming cytoskeletal protein [Cyclonatronum proteinivorum]AXJ01253.1 Polymer-forming protein [Cyclonatronum proteinivorum]